MTYYKYAERDEASRVDWANISKTYSEAIQKGLETREKKRQDIQTATDLLTESIIAQPEGTHRGVQEFYSDYSMRAQDILLDANRRLKNGEYSVRDYMALMANMNTDVQTITGLGQYYMDNHTDISERWANGESQEFEIRLGEVFQDHTNFTDTGVEFDPLTGKARIVKRRLNPETGLFEYGDALTPAELRAAMGTRYDKYDADAAANKIAEEMGQIQTAIRSGKIKTIEGQGEMDYIDEFVSQQVEASLEDGLHVSSILTMDMDGYGVSFDPKSAGANDVLGVLNPLQPNAGEKVPLISVVEQIEGLEAAGQEQVLDQIFGADLSKEERQALIAHAKKQKEVAADWMDTEIRGRFNDIEEAMPVFPPPVPPSQRTSPGERGLLRQAAAGLRSLEKLHGGDEEQATEGLQNLLDRNYSQFSEGYVTIDEETGERTAHLIRYNPGTKQLQENPIPIPASLLRTIDAFGGQFFEESVRPHLYEAYDTTERLFGGIPGTATPSVKRGRAVSADNLAGEVIEILGKEIDVATALSALKPEKSSLSSSGDKLAASNQSTLSSISAQLDLGGEFKVLLEDDMQDKLGFDPYYTAVTMRFPGVSDFEVVILNNTEGVNAQRNLFDEMSKRKLRGETMTHEEIMSYLPADSKKLNEAANHSKIASGSSAIKLSFWQWKEANAAAIAGKDAKEVAAIYLDYYESP